jgi:hypothetical protein
MASFVITGLERSGTTVVSELFRQVPGVDAGFEIGVLLGATPREFPGIEPFAGNMLHDWGLTRASLEACCDTDDFALFYERLRAASTVMRAGTRMIFDKTPRYIATLDNCMRKVAAPFFVTFKDPRATVFSDFKISGETDFDRWFDAYAPEKIGYMRLAYAQFERVRQGADRRVCMVRLEEFCLQPREACTRILAHVGINFEYSYLVFRPGRYQMAPIASISAGLPFAYIDALGRARSERVGSMFAEFAEWFFG